MRGQGERERERTDFDLGGQVGLQADRKKVSFLKIFPPSPQSSSWCSESILVVRDLFRFIRAGLRFEVSNVRLSTKVVVLGQYRIYFWSSNGIKRFLFWCREDQSKASKLYPDSSERSSILRLFLITPVFIIIVFVGKVLLLRK